MRKGTMLQSARSKNKKLFCIFLFYCAMETAWWENEWKSFVYFYMDYSVFKNLNVDFRDLVVDFLIDLVKDLLIKTKFYMSSNAINLAIPNAYF